MKYGERWRAHRRLFQQVMNPQTVSKFRHVQAEKIQEYLRRLLDDPENFSEHVERYALIIGSQYETLTND